MNPYILKDDISDDLYRIVNKGLVNMTNHYYENVNSNLKDLSKRVKHHRETANIYKKYYYKSTYNRNAQWVTKSRSKYMKFSIPFQVNHEENIVEVFIDGIKIPQDYMTFEFYEGSVDVYVPYFCTDYKNDKVSQIDFYLVDFKYNENVNVLIESQGVSGFQFVDNNYQSEKDYDLYINGILKNLGEDYNITQDSIYTNHYKVDFINHSPVGTIEIVGRQHNSLKLYEKFCKSSIFMLDDVINPELIQVYKNGLRLFNNHIELKTSRIFKITNFKKGDCVKVRYEINERMINEPLLVLDYEDSFEKYFSYKSIDEVRDIFENKFKGDTPYYIKHLVAMNRNKTLESNTPSTDFVRSDPRQKTLDTIVDLINKDSRSFRYLMETLETNEEVSFKYEEGKYPEVMDYRDYFNNIEINGDLFVLFTIPRLKCKDKVIFFINDTKVIEEDRNIQYYNDRNELKIFVRKTFLEEGSLIRISIYPNVSSMYCEVEINSDIIDTQTVVLDVENEMVPSDFILFHQKNGTIKLEEENTHYSLYRESDDTITLKYHAELNEDEILYIVNYKYFDYHKIDFTNLSMLDRVIIPLKNTLTSLITNEEDFEKCKKYFNYKLYFDGRLLGEGLHYNIIFYKGIPSVMLNFLPLVNSVLEIYTLHDSYPCVGYKYYAENALGVVDLTDTLRIPFSFKYLDLYVNGKLMSKDDVDIFSDKVIKLKNSKSRYDILVISKVKQEILTSLEPFIFIYNNVKDDWNNYIQTLSREKLIKTYNYLNDESSIIFERIGDYLNIKTRIGFILAAFDDLKHNFESIFNCNIAIDGYDNLKSKYLTYYDLKKKNNKTYYIDFPEAASIVGININGTYFNYSQNILSLNNGQLFIKGLVLSYDAEINIIYQPKYSISDSELFKAFSTCEESLLLNANESSSEFVLNANDSRDEFINRNFYREVTNNLLYNIFNNTLDVNANSVNSLPDSVTQLFDAYNNIPIDANKASLYSLNANKSHEESINDFLNKQILDKDGYDIINYGLVDKLFSPDTNLPESLFFNANDTNNRFGYVIDANENLDTVVTLPKELVLNANSGVNNFLDRLHEDDALFGDIKEEIETYVIQKFYESGDLNE